MKRCKRGLREEEQILRRDSVLQQYRNAFAGFSQDELLLLDGIVLEDRTPRRQAVEQLFGQIPGLGFFSHDGGEYAELRDAVASRVASQAADD